MPENVHRQLVNDPNNKWIIWSKWRSLDLTQLLIIVTWEPCTTPPPPRVTPGLRLEKMLPEEFPLLKETHSE